MFVFEKQLQRKIHLKKKLKVPRGRPKTYTECITNFMIARSTRSRTDFRQTTINTLLLSTKQEKHTLRSMETSQQQNINFEKQQLNLNQQDETCKDIDTDARGHELNDQRIMSNGQQQTSIQLVYNSIQKYDGNGDPQQWLKYILEKFDLLQIPSKD